MKMATNDSQLVPPDDQEELFSIDLEQECKRQELEQQNCLSITRKG